MVFWRSKKKTSDNDPALLDASVPPEQPSSAPSPPEDATPQDSAPAETPASPAVTETVASTAPVKNDSAAKGGLFSRLKTTLTKTRDALNTDIRDLFKDEGTLIDDAFLGKLFATLIRTDMGAGPAETLRDDVAKRYRGRKVQYSDVIASIIEQTAEMLKQDAAPLNLPGTPSVILVVGVNGSGKTTSIGKISHFLASQGKTIVLGAGDTFRAAAVEQLTIWSQRIGCEIVTGKSGADPASVAFQTVDKAIQINADVAIVDTAGRLQTQSNLMQELDKIRRVVGKKIDDAPHEVLLVLDSTAGQNALSQAKGFSDAAGCTGIILSKLDGSARGGVIIPIRQQFQLPVKFVGLGEGIEDIAEFDADSFAKALFTD